MYKVMRVDQDGLFLEDVFLEDNQAIPTIEKVTMVEVTDSETGEVTEVEQIDVIADPCIISVEVQGGLHWPKWDFEGLVWVEGMSQEEIDAIKNIVVPKSEVEILQEQLSAQNQTFSDFMDYIFTSFPEIA